MQRLIVSIVLLAVSTTSLPAHAFKYLSVPVRFQERNGWCFAACDQMLIRYYGKYFDEQCEIVENYRSQSPPWGTTNCCLSPDFGCSAASGGIGDEVEHMGIRVTNVGRLTYQQLKDEIDAGHPFAAHFGSACPYWGHWLVVKGYFGGEELVSIIDPAPFGSEGWGGGESIVSYSDLVDANWCATAKTSNPTSPKAKLYSEPGLHGELLTVRTGSTSFGTFDNKASSADVFGSPYILYMNQNYDFTSWGVNARRFDNSDQWYGLDNVLSSARPVPYSQNNPTGVVLFENTYFRGSYKFVKDNESLVASGWNDRANSLVVVGGLAQVFQHVNAGGLAYAVTSTGGPYFNGFYPYPESWGGPPSDISSVHVYSDDMTPSSTTSAIVLYNGPYFTGRGLLIKMVAARGGDDPMGWADYLGNQLMDDQVVSIRTYAGRWSVWSDPHQSGTIMSVLLSNGYYYDSSRIGMTGISSVKFEAPEWSTW